MVRNNVTGANYGILGWIYQRISAIIMTISFILFLIMFVYLNMHSDINFLIWKKFFNCIYVKLIFFTFFTSLIIHAWVGMRDIWMDYVKCNIIKLSLHSLTIIWLFCVFIYSLKIIWF